MKLDLLLWLLPCGGIPLWIAYKLYKKFIEKSIEIQSDSKDIVAIKREGESRLDAIVEKMKKVKNILPIIIILVSTNVYSLEIGKNGQDIIDAFQLQSNNCQYIEENDLVICHFTAWRQFASDAFDKAIILDDYTTILEIQRKDVNKYKELIQHEINKSFYWKLGCAIMGGMALSISTLYLLSRY